MSKTFKENYDSLVTYWNTKKGLVFFMLTFITVYYSVIIKFIEENLFNNKIYTVWIIPAIALLLIYLLWAVFSYRLNLYKRKILTTGIFLKCSDSMSEFRIKEILNELTQDLRDEFGEIKFKLFPINHITSKSQLSRFVKKNNHIIDNAFFATIHNGNCTENSQTISKIEIQNIVFSAVLDRNSHLDFRNNVDMSLDLNIRNLNRDWQYVDSRSFNDKTKIKHNFKDSLLFFNGLYSIYIKEYDLALKILKTLKLSEKNEIEIINISKKQRLNEILVGLFTFNAFEKYIDKKDGNSAFLLLKECEKLFNENHRFSFSNFITLSRIYFERGNLNMAKEYTDKARKIKKFSTAIYCNLGFFGMVENNPHQVFLNYKELAHVYKHKNKIDFIEIVHFIELHKKNYLDSIYLFDFAIGTINLLYVDKKMGQQQLSRVQENIKELLPYYQILDLTNILLEKGDIKSPYFHRDKKRKAS